MENVLGVKAINVRKIALAKAESNASKASLSEVKLFALSQIP